jgi:hypothetical protein
MGSAKVRHRRVMTTKKNCAPSRAWLLAGRNRSAPRVPFRPTPIQCRVPLADRVSDSFVELMRDVADLEPGSLPGRQAIWLAVQRRVRSENTIRRLMAKYRVVA